MTDLLTERLTDTQAYLHTDILTDTHTDRQFLIAILHCQHIITSMSYQYGFNKFSNQSLEGIFKVFRILGYLLWVNFSENLISFFKNPY